MPIYQLNEDPSWFPPISESEPGGLLAIGGDLSIDRLLHAYSQGIFPWYEEKQPLLWWSPTPRWLLFPHQLKVSRSLKKVIRKGVFDITLDQNFEGVIHACAKTRIAKGEGTWITQDMQQAYIELFHAGYAHSVEAWHEQQLVGGLYGVSLGRCFFGESMFALKSNASKVAFTYLTKQLEEWNFAFLDCQVHTVHLESLGACQVEQEVFLELLQQNVTQPGISTPWTFSNTLEI